MKAEKLELLLPTGLHPVVAERMPKVLLVKALIDALSGVRTPEDLVEITGLPRERAGEIVHLRELLTVGTFVTRQ